VTESKNTPYLVAIAIVMVILLIVYSTSNLSTYSGLLINLQPANNQLFDSGVEIEAYAYISSNISEIDSVKVLLFNGASWETIIDQTSINSKTWEGRKSIGTPPNGSYAIKLEFWFVDDPDNVISKANTFYVGERSGIFSIPGFEIGIIITNMVFYAMNKLYKRGKKSWKK